MSDEQKEPRAFDDMMDVLFERWWRSILKRTATIDKLIYFENIDKFETLKPAFRVAFKTGWLKCEEFYS